MTDNVLAGGIYWRADEVPAASTIYYQFVKLDVGTDGVSTPLESDTVLKAMPVTPRTKRVQIAATGLATGISTSKYTEKFVVGPTLQFTTAARVAGGTGLVRSVTVGDLDRQRAGFDLALFSQTVTATDNSVFNPNLTDISRCVGILRLPDMGGWRDFSTTSAVTYIVPEGGLPYTCLATTLFGVLILRSQPAPTYTTTSSLNLSITVDQD